MPEDKLEAPNMEGFDKENTYIELYNGDEEGEKFTPKKLADLSNEELEEAFKGNEIKNIELNKNIVDVLVDMGVAQSKRQAREFISNNSIEIKGEKINDLDKIIDNTYLTNNTYLIIKRGKKNYYVGK